MPLVPGKKRRVFDNGKMKEVYLIDLLKKSGLQINNSQKYVELHFHVGGSCDGIIYEGVPEAPDKTHVLEIKTCADKYFKKEVPEMHRIQCNLYMHGLNIDRALYVCENKNDQELYIERIKYDVKEALKYVERGKKIVFSDRMPEPCNTNPTYYKCKMCDFYDFCHVKTQTKQVNCRTCAHSTPMNNKTAWKCDKFNCELPYENMLDGCKDHVVHPDLVPWVLDEEKSTEWTACYIIDGKEFMNGEGGKPSWWLLLDEKTREICDAVEGIPTKNY